MTEPVLEAVARMVGYRLGDQARLLLKRALERAATGEGSTVEEAARRVLARASPAWRLFTDAVAIHETYFFRHPEHFALLERFATERAARGAPVRTAWSVGCATGEEAWSLALTLWPLSPALRVAGSDLAAGALATARAGRYPTRAFRELGPTRKPGLVPHGASWEVIDRIRERVLFAPLNLAIDPIRPPAGLPGEVDVIFCRNVLVYLQPEVARRAFEALGQCLAPGGLLIVNAIEVPARVPPELELEPLEADAPGVFLRPVASRGAAREPRPVAPTVPPDRALPGQRTPTGERLLGEARQLADEGQHAEALQRAAALAHNPGALYLSAAIEVERGNLDQAELLLRRLLELAPQAVPAHLQLALLAARRNDAGALARHRATAQRLLAARGDGDDLGLGGMKAAWARQVLASLHPEAGA